MRGWINFVGDLPSIEVLRYEDTTSLYPRPMVLHFCGNWCGACIFLLGAFFSWTAALGKISSTYNL